MKREAVRCSINQFILQRMKESAYQWCHWQPMRAGSGTGPAPCFCMAAHMLLQHHIFSMRHRHVEMVAAFKTLTNKTPRRYKKGVKLTCACLRNTETDNSCDGDLVNTRRLPGCNRDTTSLVASLVSRLMQYPAFLSAAVTEQVGSQPVGAWISGILGQTVRWDRYRSAAARGRWWVMRVQ